MLSSGLVLTLWISFTAIVIIAQDDNTDDDNSWNLKPYQFKEWNYHVKLNQSDIDGLDKAITEAIAYYNTTALCAAPHLDIAERHDERLRGYFLAKYPVLYTGFSRVIYCKDEYSIRLYNARHPVGTFLPLFVRVFCRDALTLARNLFNTMRDEWLEYESGGNGSTPKHGRPHPSKDFEDLGVPYFRWVLFAETFWTQDWTWGVLLGREFEGCKSRPIFDKNIIVTDSSWA
ncbi:hypothetical protein ABW19_dt0208214 [Dactylella cylindrospora]|nr:hypothetical protein ABW19_dt0208214 [Dactylella cylindrospora]